MENENTKLGEDLISGICKGISKYLVDLSKLIFGGIILTGIIGLQIDANRLIWLGAIAVLFTAMLGGIFYIIGKLIKR